MTTDPNAIRIRNRLTNPYELCGMLGLLDGHQRQSGGVMIRCPAHAEKTPSCSVTVGPDGTVRARCFGCQWTADALGLVGMARGLTGFGDVLREAAALAGVELEDRDQDRNGRAASDRDAPSQAPVRPVEAVSEDARTYPPADELRAFWRSLVRLVDAPEAAGMIQITRGIPVAEVDAAGVARAMPEGAPVDLPSWATFRRRSWLDTSHRVVLPAFDATGTMRSVRAWRVRTGEGYDDTPKRLPPSGHKAAGLVLANRVARAALASEKRTPLRWVFAEGEPDFLVWSCRSPGDAVVGIVSGGWTEDHAKRIAFGSTVVIRTHRDKAGDKYAAEIVASLKGRVRVMRGGQDEQAA